MINEASRSSYKCAETSERERQTDRQTETETETDRERQRQRDFRLDSNDFGVICAGVCNVGSIKGNA